MLRTRVLAPFVALAATLAAAANAQPVPVLVLRTHGAAALSADGPDAALRAALAMLPARVAELPGEAPDMPPEAAALIRTAMAAVARPATLSLCYDPMNVAGGMFGYGFVLSFECENDADAAMLHAVLEEGMRQSPALLGPPEASADFDGMKEAWTAIAQVRYGPRRVGQATRYELHVGSVSDPAAGLDALPATLDAPGFTPTISAVVNLAGLTPAATIARSLPGPQAPQLAQATTQMQAAGLIGESAMRISMQDGIAKDAAHTRTTIHGARRYSEALGMSTTGLTTDDLRAVPADAHFASLATMDMGFPDRLLAQLRANGLPVDHALAQVTRATGIDPLEDVLRTLGGAVAVYTSDSTGAGSLLSGVIAFSVRDAERLRATRVKVASLANGAIAAQDERAAMYLRVEPWTLDGDEYYTVRARGVPVPVEFTCALTDRWLILAPSAQAAVAAVRQATGRGDEGLTANRAFASRFAAVGAPVTAATFINTDRTLRAGYPFLVLAGAAVGNTVRSPHGDARDPGMIVPLYNDLRRNAQPVVQLSWWEGDDKVTHTTGDRSLLVRAGGVLGAGAPVMPIVAVAAISGGSRPRAIGGLDADWITSPATALAARAMLGDPAARLVMLLGASGGYASWPGDAGRDALPAPATDAQR
ncbi:MAG TPA: hypothetical protein PLU35_03975 [Phycisphaerales bacterium]|nr:hypothetical protein [Phycisphaerales bacterium]